MDLAVINVITGAVSAVCAVVSLGYFANTPKEQAERTNTKLFGIYESMSFLLVCSGWALLCLSYLWFFEPFGPYIRDDEYRQFFAVVLSVPALLILRKGFVFLGKPDTDETD